LSLVDVGEGSCEALCDVSSPAALDVSDGVGERRLRGVRVVWRAAGLPVRVRSATARGRGYVLEALQSEPLALACACE